VTNTRRRENPVVEAERVGRLFTDAGTLLRPYSDDQVGRGLAIVVNPSLGGEIRALGDRRVPVRTRVAGLRAIVPLFRDVFAVRLQGQGIGSGTPLADICFMFWDVAPLGGDTDTILDVLEQTLALPSGPCRYAALHGLGHWHHEAPEAVRSIVDGWLAKHPRLPEDIRQYAAQARVGAVN
jgi:hypothetical protein